MSKFFKATFVNPKRWGAMATERQIQDLLEQGSNWTMRELAWLL